VKLGEEDVRVVALRRKGPFSTWKKYESVTVQAKPVEHIDMIPCFLRIALTPGEVIRACLGLGRPDRALEFAKSLPQPPDSVELFEAAVASSDAELALRLKPAARDTLADLKKALRSEPSEFRISGVNGFYYDEFSALRFYSNHASRVHLPNGSLPEWIATQNAGGDNSTYSCALILPARLSQGRYILRGRIAVEPHPANAAAAGTFEIRDGTNGLVLSGSFPEFAAKGWIPFSHPMDAGRETSPVLTFVSAIPARIFLSDFEIDWDVRTLLAARKDDLVRSLDQLEAMKEGVPAK
jgi:hypothetical protein